MITWNIDLSQYSVTVIEELLDVAEKMDAAIATKIKDYLFGPKQKEFNKPKS